MARKEFSKTIKVAKIRACTIDGVTRCEKCKGVAMPPHVDHIDPDGMTGQPVIENAMVLCVPCHKEKTAVDVANIAKAKRREAKDLGVRKTPTLTGPGFPLKKSKPEPRPSLPPRILFQ